jgi:SAM-dependent methyltransferase
MTNSPTSSGFDAAKFKQTTEQQWQDAAQAWFEWTSTLDTWLGPATELMLDMAGISTGSRVLDVAAGCGGQSVTAARRVGMDGRVLATDLSSRVLDYARQLAAEAGLGNLETAVLDGENLAVPPASFDAAISRVGMIYFPDQQKALRSIGQALRPGGRFATIVYSTAENNRFFSDPVRIIRKAAQLPPPLPGQPGPFSLGGPGVLAGVLKQAGFVEVTEQVVNAPLVLPSADDCLRFEKESFGALHQMLTGLDDAQKEAAWQEVHIALREFESGNGFSGPCELVVAGGTWQG